MPKTQKTQAEPVIDAALLGVSAEAAIEALASASAKHSPEALIDAWVKAGNAAAVSEVAERGSGAARKAARRGVNVLKSRGVAIPQRSNVTRVAGPREAETLEAWMLAPDSLGTLLVVIASRTATSRLRSAFFFINANVGVQRVDLMELSQSQLRDSLNNALRGGEYKPVKVPVEWARQRVEQARKLQKERGLLEPLGLGSAKSLLEPLPEGPVEHPFDTEGLELADEDAAELAKKSGQLHTVPEFRGWVAPGPAVDELLSKVGDTLTPGEEPAEDWLVTRLEEEVKAATDRYFTPERRAALITLMKDSALSILTREGEVRALEVVATMKVIEGSGLITNPPHEVPFLRAFFDKAIGGLLAQGKGRLRIPVRQKSAIVTPDEAAAEAKEAPAEG